MFTRMAGWSMLAGVILVACKDSSTALGDVQGGPRFSAASDTGGGGGGGGGGTPVFHFVSNGDNGYVTWSNFTGDTLGGYRFTSGVVSTGRGGTTKNPMAYLDYTVYEFGCDALWNCFYNLVGAGYGLIPVKDLGASGKQLRLETNTANNPNFFVYAGVAGPVSVTWNADGLYENSSAGTSSSRFANTTHKSQGSSTSWSAIASGSLAGTPVGPYGTATFGTNHLVTIDIYR